MNLISVVPQTYVLNESQILWFSCTIINNIVLFYKILNFCLTSLAMSDTKFELISEVLD